MVYTVLTLAPCFSVTMVYFYLSFFQHKNELYFIKRGKSLIQIEYILLISKVAFEVPFLMTSNYLSIFDSIHVGDRYLVIFGYMSFCGLANIIMIRIGYFYVQCTRVNFATETFRFSNTSEMVTVHDKQHTHVKKSQQADTNDKNWKNSSNLQ